MHRAFSFPMSVERSRNKERLEDRLAGLCELELRKQRQECLVLGALAQGDPMSQNPARNQLSGFSSWGQENLTLRRQLSALQSSPWGLMLALEQQVSELRVDRDNLAYEGNQKDTDDSRPRSGFYESSEAQSPKERSCSSELTETASTWIYSSERPKSLGDAFLLNRESLPYSFSAPYPPLEGIAEEGLAEEPWQWDPQCAHSWEDHATEEDYQQALRVEGYILGLIQRHTLSPRTYHTRTSLGLDPSYSSNNSRQSSLRRKTSPHTAEHRIPDPLEHLQDSESQAWGYNPLEEEACGQQAPSTGDGYISLSYPHSRPHSLVGGLLPSLDPNCGALDACCSIKSDSPQHCPFPLSPVSRNHLISAQYIPGQTCHAPVCSPIHCAAEPSNHSRASVSPDHSSPNPRSIVKKFHELQSSKKPCHRTSHSQSENNLLGQQGLPERRYSTTERPQGRRGQGQAMGPQASGTTGGQRWCSTLELSQKEGDIQGEQAHRRPPRRTRQSKSQAHAQPQHSECLERAPLCWGEGYKRAAPGESESSMSEVYSPASSSLSSDSDEGGGLVWPQQLPPRLDPSTSTSSSSSSPQVSSDASSQPKAFVKIKASHALKKKILRFRSGSLKVMTTV